GNYVKKNDNKASNLFKQVVQSNSKFKDNAKYHLAMHFVKKNKNKALFLFDQVSQSNLEYKDNAKYMLTKINKKSLTRLYLLSGVGCQQDINNSFRKIVKAMNFHIPNAKYWIQKYGEKKDYSAEEAMQNLKNQYKNKTNESEYVRARLASYFGQLQGKEISTKKEKLIKEVTKNLKLQRK
ncbi:42867_t:CDS:2, partial [Gigaspora margarita]